MTTITAKRADRVEKLRHLAADPRLTAEARATYAEKANQIAADLPAAPPAPAVDANLVGTDLGLFQADGWCASIGRFITYLAGDPERGNWRHNGGRRAGYDWGAKIAAKNDYGLVETDPLGNWLLTDKGRAYATALAA